MDNYNTSIIVRFSHISPTFILKGYVSPKRKSSSNCSQYYSTNVLKSRHYNYSIPVNFSWINKYIQCLSKKDMNKLMHSINGNKRGKIAINTGYWNCGKGLLDRNNNASPKISEAAAFINENDLDILAVAEAGLHGPRSRIIRTNPLTTASIERELRIPGFRILLPESWYIHDTARIFMYIKEDINFKVIKYNNSIQDLPLISIEAKRGKHATTIISTHYREFTGGISGLKTNESQ